MALSHKAFVNLSHAITDDVAEYITEDHRFFEMLMQVIPDAITDKLGDIDNTLLAEMSCYTAENLKVAKS
jgi:hypothetical protein